MQHFETGGPISDHMDLLNRSEAFWKTSILAAMFREALLYLHKALAGGSLVLRTAMKQRLGRL